MKKGAMHDGRQDTKFVKDFGWATIYPGSCNLHALNLIWHFLQHLEKGEPRQVAYILKATKFEDFSFQA